uniref:Glutathione S-transferase omega-2 n=1 Tax=Lygus hesperus TaxID=30085 RepID=A0A0A9XR79_LYGHE
MMTTMNAQPALKLFTNPLCPYCQKVEIVIAERGLDVERVIIPFKDMPDWYKQLNPRHTVPSLQVDGKRMVFESLLICKYLNDLPAGRMPLSMYTPYNQYRIDFFLQQFDLFVTAIRNFMMDPMNEEKRHSLDEYVCYTDKLLYSLQTTGPFVCDDEFSLADACIVPHFIRFRASLNYYCFYDLFEHAPHMKKLLSVCMNRPSVRNTTRPIKEYLVAHNHHMPKTLPVSGANGNYVLFGSKMSPFVQAVRLMCASKKIKPFMIEINPSEPPTWFAYVNPRGTVPVLMTPEGVTIHESRTIMQYIHEVSAEHDCIYKGDAEKLYAVNFFMTATNWFTNALRAFLHNPTVKEMQEELVMTAKQL